MTAIAKINLKQWGDGSSKPSMLDPAKYGRLLAETLPAVILRNKDLEPALGSRGVTSEVISGKRKPSKTQIKKLAEFFGCPCVVYFHGLNEI